jgi:hypothetical protein
MSIVLNVVRSHDQLATAIYEGSYSERVRMPIDYNFPTSLVIFHRVHKRQETALQRYEQGYNPIISWSPFISYVLSTS